MKDNYEVALPNPEMEDFSYSWIRRFKTKDEAIQWAIENLGADEEGKIKVVRWIK